MADADWTALILAGQRPGENAFALAHGVEAKALIPVGGEPMLGRVIRVLRACASVRRIVLLAQEPEALAQGELGWIADDPGITLARSGSGISGSIAAIAGTEAAPWPVLVTTADHALLTPDMIGTFIAGMDGADVAVGLVERRVVEAAWPETKRTWIRFADGDYSGANLFALRDEASRKALDLWSTVERDRKKAVRLLMHFGPLLALRAVTRTISLDAALGKVARRLGISARAVRLPFAEAAIDVDKEADLELVERIIAGHQTQKSRQA